MCVIKGTYEKDGKTQKNYQNIGAVMQGENDTFYALIDVTFNLAAFPRQEGRNMVMVPLFKPKAKESTTPF
jgi:hypothetical protein